MVVFSLFFLLSLETDKHFNQAKEGYNCPGSKANEGE
jgi:hypothetical protein